MKLNKVKGYKTTTYEVESAYFNGFLVDIVERRDITGDNTNENYWEAWLYHKNIGIKELMFGFPKGYSLNEFLDIVVDSLLFGIHLKDYIKTCIWEETEEE